MNVDVNGLVKIFNRDFRAVFYGESVVGVVACKSSDAAYVEFIIGVSAFFLSSACSEAEYHGQCH